MLESLFKKVVSFNFIKRKLQHRYFPVNFCEIFKDTYFVEYLQRLYLPIAASPVENVLTFSISILAAFAKLPKQQIAVASITQSKTTRYNKSHILLHNIVSNLLYLQPRIFQLFDQNHEYILPKTFLQKNFLVLQHVYAYIFINISYLYCFD